MIDELTCSPGPTAGAGPYCAVLILLQGYLVQAGLWILQVSVSSSSSCDQQRNHLSILHLNKGRNDTMMFWASSTKTVEVTRFFTTDKSSKSLRNLGVKVSPWRCMLLLLLHLLPRPTLLQPPPWARPQSPTTLRGRSSESVGSSTRRFSEEERCFTEWFTPPWNI